MSVFCGPAPTVGHGSHSGGGGAGDQFPVETVLKYSCFPGEATCHVYHVYHVISSPGYLIVGFAHAKCFVHNNTAQWFGPDLFCQRESTC